MVNTGLIETILREQDNPGHSTTRQIRDLYNNRSGEEPIIAHTDEDQQFQKLLLQALENFPGDDTPISYTVKLKECDDTHTPTVKRRSIIKLPKETKDQSESDEQLSDVEKLATNSSITVSKPFSPLFLNNMKKFGVSSDWLAKRSNSLKQSSYSRSSIKSNTSRFDAMIKSVSNKPIKSNRKLSFIEMNSSTNNENDKENVELVEQKKIGTPYDLSSEEEEEEKETESMSSDGKDFALRIPRVNLQTDEKQQLNASTSSSSSSSLVDEEVKQEKPTVVKKRQRKSAKESGESSKPMSVDDEIETKNVTSTKTSKTNQEQTRIEHLKKLLRLSGIKPIIKKTELEQFHSNKQKINYLKSIFDSAGFQGNLTIKDCEKFRKKRDAEKELEEIQSKAIHVKGHVKGGRTLRGQARTSPNIEPLSKRKRHASSEVEENNDSSSEDEKPTTKKRRILEMQPSPEISDDD